MDMKKPDFTQRFGFLVNDVARLHGRRFDQRVREIGLTRAQCRVLGTLYMRDGQSQAALAELLEQTPMAIARMTDRMEAAGWLRREPHPDDRRIKLLFLNDAAEGALREAMRIGDSVQAEALAGLSDDETSQLLALLQKARTNLAQLERPEYVPPDD
ncbi:transcriptional regulator, MarR family [Andreprevotia lacus DSM 23236]|jgi:DNA-binding MarR family transcriptional regulator|uniref:Transcriptional regulator, MarR family n=1 Tax=Andreprevotia lacus DSM 23236 TaxID=1121001 RepID=A0A1W1X2N9_9NEIS|nr:MarR family transcriptional regulator [Andreprevotia lacus]SMC17671.1 transcriptional regulator, MarR family [Andreprevotia lacus DSM 23236]